MRRQFLDRKKEYELLLEASLQPGFQFKRVTLAGEIDVTEDYRQSLRKAIAEYQQATDMLGPSE